MIKLRNSFRLLVGYLLLLSLSGCFSSKFVEQKQYLLEIKKLPEKNSLQKKCLVAVESITAIDPFDQLNFLYRINSNQYLTDYYHGFIAPPTEQLERPFINYLKALAGGNLEIADISSAQNKLKVQITEFYADYSDRNHPYARVALRFILSRSSDDKNIVLLDKNFSSQVALQEKTTDSLLKSWNMCVQDVFRQGISAINAVLYLYNNGNC